MGHFPLLLFSTLWPQLDEILEVLLTSKPPDPGKPT